MAANKHTIFTSSITIASANINSINNSLQNITNFVQHNKIDILFLQETHRIDTQRIQQWSAANSFHFFHNAPSIHETDHHFKSGVACIFTSRAFVYLQPQIQNIYPNRAQFISFHINKEKYLLANLYLPSGNSHSRRVKRENMINLIADVIDQHDYDHLLLLGDFNLVTHHLDSSAPIHRNQDYHSLQNMLKEKHLKDSFRTLYPKERQYSYTRNNSRSRIDRIYIPHTFTHRLIAASYIPLSFSDHTAAPLITLDLLHPILPSRKTMWKLNDSLTLGETSKARFRVHLDKWTKKPSRLLDPLKWWENFKMATQALYKDIGKIENSKHREAIAHIKYSIQQANPPETTTLITRLQELEKRKERGAMIRARIQPLEDDETPTKSFFQLEKSSQTATTIPSIQEDRNSPEITDPNEIKTKITEYYKAIWNQPQTLLSQNPEHYLADIPKIQTPLLTQDDSPFVNEEEVSAAIDHLNKHSSPGYDGLTATLYKTFQKELTPILCQLFNNIFLRRELPPSHTLAIIKLIPKTGSPKLINNWRPISLLNTDYKILANIIANRLKPILSSYISPSQHCALSNRHLHDNLLNTLSAIDYSTDISHPLAILQLDFHKAFDSLSHSFILATMRQIGIPSSLTQWTSTLLSSNFAQIKVNHTLTRKIPICNGIRQGCPLSMLLFVMATDVLAKKISSAPDIHGIRLGKASLSIQQYADDTTLFFTNPNEINKALQICKDFSLHTNLKLNSSKTNILSNSKLLIQSTQSKMPEAKSLQDVKILGIRMSFSKQLSKLNWKTAVAKIRNISYQHRHRQLTIYGKLCLIKTLLLPHITNMARLFHCPKATQQTISFILYKFFWTPHTLEPIKRATLTKLPKHGGIGFPCVQTTTQTSLAIRTKSIINDKDQTLFWTQYGIYNLGTRIKDILPEIYSNSMPHRPKPNSQWNLLLETIKSHPITSEKWTEISHQDLYQTILKSTPCQLPRINASAQPTNWSQILLLAPSHKQITNMEREVNFRVAHSGYLFGHFNSTHNINTLSNGTKRINTCKFCAKPKDSTTHVFYDCPISRRIITNIQKHISNLTKQSIIISKALVLYNVTRRSDIMHKSNLIRIVSQFRLQMHLHKRKLDTSNETIKNQETFISKLTQEMKTAAHNIFNKT